MVLISLFNKHVAIKTINSLTPNDLRVTLVVLNIQEIIEQQFRNIKAVNFARQSHAKLISIKIN